MYSRMLSLAVFFLGAVFSPALGKPPELPADVKDECRERDEPQPNGVILTSARKKTAPIVEEVPASKEAKEFEDFCALDFLCPCASECVRRFWQALTVVAAPTTKEQEDKQAPDSDAAGMTLPAERYLQHQTQFIPPSSDFPLTKELAAMEGVPAEQAAAKKKATKQASCGLEGDVCHNLAVLKLAKMIYRKAEACRQRGESDKAERYYERIQRLSPGSRYDRLASKRLVQLHTAAEPAAAVAEQESAGPDPKVGCSAFTCPYLQQEEAKKRQHAAKPALEPGTPLENLDKLEHARKLYRRAERCRHNGDEKIAAQLYRQVHELTPGSRYDELAQKRLTALQTPGATDTGEESEDTTPTPKPEPQPQSPGEPEAVLLPMLPAVDPKLVDALEQLLIRTGDPACPKLVIQVDDVDPAQEHADDPLSQWPLQPFDAAVPGSLLDPAADPELTEEPEPNPAEIKSPPSSDVDFVLRDVLASLQARACIEIDPSRLGTDMPLGQIQLGPVLVRLVADDFAGWRCFLVTLKSQPADAPRALQQKQNEKILRWIESLNGDLQERSTETWDDPGFDEILDEDSDS